MILFFSDTPARSNSYWTFPVFFLFSFFLKIGTWNLELGACSAQSVGIFGSTNLGVNNTGAHGNVKAVFDISSPDKGILIPRITTASRDTFTNIPTSLLFFNTTTNQYEYYDGAAWKAVAAAGTNWSLTGNSGTVDGTNFIGTTDNIPFNIRVNNAKAGRISSGDNLFLGYLAGANSSVNVIDNIAIGDSALYTQSFATAFSSQNVAIGNSALFLNNPTNTTTGRFNTAVGNWALRNNTTGNFNAANGLQSLYNNTTGGGNTANGSYALYSNTEGNYNTANGMNALYYNIAGWYNTANGINALYSNVAGSNATAIGYNAMCYANNTATTFTNFNVAVGYEALRGSANPANNFGNFNTALGYKTLWSTTSGGNNTALGYLAGYTTTAANALTTGSNNTFLGYNTGFASATQRTNATAIGYNAKVDADNAMALGGTGADAVNVGIGTTVPVQKLEIRDGSILLSNTGTAGELRFAEPGFTDYTAFKAQAQAGNIIYTLPASLSAGNFLSTDGSGNLTWSSVSGTLSGGTINYIPKWASATALSSTSLLFDNGTGVGIGTTVPFAKLQIKQTGSNEALYIENNGSASNVYSYNNGTGNAGFFEISNVGNNKDALYSASNGTGNAIYGKITGSGFAAVYGYSNGTARAGYFEINYAPNNADALTGETNGSGNAVQGHNYGSGRAGYFLANNTSSSADAVYIITSGNDSKALNIAHSGTLGVGTNYGVYSLINGARGAGSTNIGGYFSASGATNNYSAIFDQGNVGIGTTSPAALLSVGTSSPFQVNSAGNILKINNVATSFPAVQGGANSVLSNNGTGTLTWSSIGSLGGVTGVTASAPLSSSGGTAPNITLGTVGVGNGGTGSATFTANALLLGNGTSPVSSLTFGTANQILGMNATATANEYKTINGTANQISVSNAAGSITLSTPQNINNTASPTFSGLTLSGLTANSFLYSGAAGALTTTADPTNGQLLIGSTGAAPVKAALTAGSGINITNGAGSISIATTGGTLSGGTTNYIPKWASATSLSSTSLMYDDGTGVGIGTNSPSAKLHIDGTANTFERISSSADASGTLAGIKLLMYAGYTGTHYDITAEKSDAVPNSGQSDLVFRKNFSSAGGYLTFLKFDNLTSNVILNSDKTTASLFGDVLIPNGNVGIGTTSPSQKLDVVNTIGQAMVSVNGTANSGVILKTSGTNNWEIYHNNAQSALYFYSNSLAGVPLTIKNAGSVGIGTTNPVSMLSVGSGSPFQVNSTGNIVKLNNVTTSFPGANASGVLVNDGTGTLSWTANGATGGGLPSGTTGQTLRHNGTDWISNSAIFNDGTNVGIGTTNPLSKLNIAGTSQYDAAILLQNFAANNTEPRIMMTKSRNATIGGNTIVANGDLTGQLGGWGNDGATYWPNGLIEFEVDGTPGLNDMPGRITFNTTPDGSQIAAERMRISSTGNVGIGTTAPSATLTISKTGGFSTTQLRAFSSGSAMDAPVLQFNRARGAEGAPTVALSGDDLGFIDFQSYNGASFSGLAASIGAIAAANHTGASSPAHLRFFTTAAGSTFSLERMRITSTGNIGIGTIAPTELLYLKSGDADIDGETNSAVESSSLHLLRSRGTTAAPTIILNGDYFGQVEFKGYDGAAFQMGAYVQGTVDAVPAANSMPGRLEFFTTPDGSATALSRMVIKSTGNVGIGTTNPGTSKTFIMVPNTDALNPTGLTVTNNYTGASSKYGIDVNVDGAGSGVKYGISSSVVGLALDASSIYGYQVSMTPNGTGTSYGIYSTQTSAGTGSRTGIYNSVAAGATNVSVIYGTRNIISNAGTGSSYGIYNTGEDYNYFSGNVGIGVSIPVYKLQVSAAAAGNGFTLWTNYSDARLKKNIKEIDCSLANIMKLRPVQFNYNEKYLRFYNDSSSLTKVQKGFIAQEIMQIFPEMVGTTSMDGEEYFDLNLSNLQIYLVKAMQEQQIIIDSLKQALNDQQSTINNIYKENQTLHLENSVLKSDVEKIKEYLELKTKK